MPSDQYDKAIADYYREQATLNAGSTANVNPVNATTALQAAPKAGLAPASIQNNPAPVVAQLQQQDNHAILQSSPHVQSFVASDATKAAAVGDSYKSLAALGQWAQDHVGMAKATGSGLFNSVASFAGALAFRPIDQLMSTMQSAAKFSDLLSGNLTEADFKPVSSPGELYGQTLTQASGAAYTPQNETERIAYMVGGALPFAAMPGSALSRIGAVVLPTAGSYAGQQGVKALGGGEDLQSIGGALGGMLGVLPHALGSVRVPPKVVEAYVKARYGVKVTGVSDAPQGPYTDQLRLPGPEGLTRNTTEDGVTPPPVDNIPDDFNTAAHIDSMGSARDIIQNAPIAQRAPEIVADFLENHTPVGDEKVWIPAQTLLEQQLQGKYSFGYTDTALFDSIQNGDTHVEVPMSDYLAYTANNPDANLLDKQVRYQQNGQSLEEYKQQQEVEAALAAPKETNVIPPLSAMTKVGEKLAGSNPGAVYEDEYGSKFLVKGSAQETLKSERAINEAQANALYAAVTGQQNLVHLVDLGNEHGGGLGIASRLLNNAKPFDISNAAHKQSLQSDYALHAWLANRDVVGLDFDNVLAHGSGVKPIDLGGALRFRGMGELKKDFGPIPLELEGFKNPAIAPQAAQVFSGMSKEDEKYSAENIQYVSPTAIREAITLNDTVPFDQELYDTLIARQKNILARYELPYPFSEQEVLNGSGQDVESLFDQLFPVGTDVDNFPEPADLGIMLEPDQQAEWDKAKPAVKAAIVKAANDLFLNSLFEDNKALGMNKKTFKNYSDKVQKEFMQKAVKLWKKTLNNIRKERGQEWRAAYAVNQLAVENQVLSEPGIKASHLIRYSNKLEDPLRKDNAFVDAKGNPITFYHGAWHNDIGITAEELAMKKAEFKRLNPHTQVDFSPNPWRPINYNVISFSTDPTFADKWKAGNYDLYNKLGRIRTLYVTHLKASRPGDFRNPADVEKALQWYIKQGLVEKSYEDSFRKQLADGAYERWENPVMWKDCGFDAAYMLEEQGQARDKPNACVGDNSQVYFKYEIRPGVESPTYKLSPEIKKLYPKALWENLPNIMFSAEDGLDADTVAAALDMDSGEALLNSLSQVELARGKVPFRKFVGDMIKQGTMEKTKADVGDVASPEAILAEAKALFAEPDITTLLEERLKQVADALTAQGQRTPFSKDDVKNTALRSWEKQPVDIAGDTRKLEKQLAAQGKAGQVALANGDTIKAFDAWQKQLIVKYQLTEAYKLQKSFKSIAKTLSRWAKADAIPGMDPAVSAVLQKELENLGYDLSRDSAELDRFLADPTVNKGFTDITAVTHMMYLVGKGTVEHSIPANLYKVNGVKLPKFTVTQFVNYTNMLKAIATFGRDEDKVIRAGKRVALDNVVTAVVRNGAKLGNKYTNQQLQDRRTQLFGKTKSIVKTVLVLNYRPEVYLHWLDGDKIGVLSESAVAPLMDGKYLAADLTDAYVKAMQAVDKEYNIFKTQRQALTAPPMMDFVGVDGERATVIKTRGDLRTALIYLGTEGARERLLVGFDWGKEQEDWILSQVRPDDIAFAEAYWAENEKIFPLADKMYMRVRGYGVEKQEPREIVLPDGTTLKGGYTHIQYNKGLAIQAKLKQIKNGLATPISTSESVVDKNYPVTSLPVSGYTKSLTNVAGPVDLAVDKLSTGVNETIHDISYREALINAQKILTEPRVKGVLEKVLGPEYQAQILPWLEHIAHAMNYPEPNNVPTIQFIRKVTSNLVFSKIALNPKAALTHSGIGFGHMLNEIKDPVLLAQCLGEVLEVGPQGDALRDFISAKSGEVRTMLWHTERAVSDGLAFDEFTGGFQKDFHKMGYVIFTISKLVESRATWLARYRQEVNRTGDSTKAVLTANKAVRDTQGASSLVDNAPNLRRSNTLLGEFAASVFQILMGFRNTAPNRFFTAARLIDRGFKTLVDNNSKALTTAGGGGGGDVIDGDFTVLDEGADPEKPSASADFGKASSILMTYVVVAAIIGTLIGVFRGDHAKDEKATDHLLEKMIVHIGDQVFGSYGYISIAYSTIEAAFEHYGADNMLQGTITDLVKLKDMPLDKASVKGVEILASLFGFGIDSVANAAQIGVYAAQDKLSEEDKSPVGIAQTVVLGRKTDAEHADKKHTSHRR